MKQIGVDIIELPEAKWYNYAVIAIDYFTKYCHGKALVQKSSAEVAQFLFEWITLFGCPSIIINDQGKEFCNKVTEELQKLTGVQQRVTRAYNPQANGQVENQNDNIKCGLLKVLLQNVSEWPDVLDGVMFGHRTQKQKSTNYSPYYLLFGQEPTLPIDVYIENIDKQESEESGEEDDPEEMTAERQAIT